MAAGAPRGDFKLVLTAINQAQLPAVVAELMDIFQLDQRTATGAVQNAPIVLIGGMSRAQAANVRTYLTRLTRLGAQLSFTAEPLGKLKQLRWQALPPIVRRPACVFICPACGERFVVQRWRPAPAAQPAQAAPAPAPTAAAAPAPAPQPPPPAPAPAPAPAPTPAAAPPEPAAEEIPEAEPLEAEPVEAEPLEAEPLDPHALEAAAIEEDASAEEVEVLEAEELPVAEAEEVAVAEEAIEAEALPAEPAPVAEAAEPEALEVIELDEPPPAPAPPPPSPAPPPPEPAPAPAPPKPQPAPKAAAPAPRPKPAPAKAAPAAKPAAKAPAGPRYDVSVARVPDTKQDKLAELLVSRQGMSVDEAEKLVARTVVLVCKGGSSAQADEWRKALLGIGLKPRIRKRSG